MKPKPERTHMYLSDLDPEVRDREAAKAEAEEARWADA